MDQAKCQALKETLSVQPEPQIVSIKEFFDGNDDLGSMGCNLIPHPGISTFRDVLTGLLSRDDVQAVYAQISELDPGEESWPFSDIVLVAGEISVDELQEAVSLLQPGDVAEASGYSISPSITERHRNKVLAVWWD